MATKTFCDRCGAEGAGLVTLSMTASDPRIARKLPSFNRDLCARCLDLLSEDVKRALSNFKTLTPNYPIYQCPDCGSDITENPPHTPGCPRRH